MKWKKAYNYYIGSSIIMLLLLAAMGALIIYPALIKIITIKNEISAEKTALENKLNMGLNAKKIMADLQKVESDLSILDSAFIRQSDELALLSDIEALAAKNSVSVSLKPDFSGVDLKNGVTRNALSISAQGSFKNLMAFMNDLDSTDFYIISDQINLAKTTGDSLALNITGQVYIKTASN